MKQLFQDEELKKELDKHRFSMYDVDKDKELATKYSIRYVPTLVFIDNNVVVEKVSGYQSKSEILKILEKY